MNAYRTFMDRQRLSETAHRRLLELERPVKEKTRYWKQWSVLAASLALVLGAGLFALGRPGALPPVPTPPGPVAAVTPSASPALDGVDNQLPEGSFVAQGPGEGAKLMFPAILGVDYTDATDLPDAAASLVWPDGAFTRTLVKEDILKIFWGPEGKPEVENPKADTGDFPLFLMNWQNYTISGQATYDGQGDLWMLVIQGELGEDSFTLTLCPGRLPPHCCVYPDLKTTTVLDTEVTGWYQSYDRDGDGQIEHVVNSALMAGGYGMEFENVGAPIQVDDGVTDPDLAGARQFNAMFVNHMARQDRTLYLEHLRHTGDIPVWRVESFDTLAQARNEAGFAPYLPQAAPQGFGEFTGHLRYQEGQENILWTYWHKGYDSVNVEVYRPEGDQNDRFVPVDINAPASYDWRLYDGPICDTVPEEYQMDFYSPTFRAQDMSLETVLARGREKDTGGTAYRFQVLHPDGTVVRYDCSAVSAEYIWSLVEATL